MKRTILYYPTIDIPRADWLRHALLYWDEVSSIVPKSWDNELLLELSPEIHYLMDEEQFRPVKPEELTDKPDNWEAFEAFQVEFKETVRSDEFQGFLKRRAGSHSIKIHSNKVGNSSRIHSNKTNNGIYEFLEELGLAKRNQDSEWIDFENSVAMLYMSLLAKYLADAADNYTVIGTDNAGYEKLNFKADNRRTGIQIMSLSLHNIMPTPNSNVPFEEIIKFKRLRKDNLSHFNKNISAFESKAAKVTSNSEMKEIAIDFHETLMNGVKDLDKALSDSRIEHVFKSFKSLINLKSPTSFAAIGALVNSQTSLFDIPVATEALGVAAIGAIELAGNYIDASNKRRVRLRESAFSYVYYAQKAGFISRYN
ncbi:DUF6236 family protein [Hymenobacter negativus]|uniref:Uncharacterized protein n=1 Tax=Hymenobacter negativus TaxID=2795026 RepID=A0ABS0Q5P5_9BACT|nr:DUF6236 family protein [Hymenobacter negativus]MBH8557905.1 hypothetical protein [Hymenobacter negativus]